MDVGPDRLEGRLSRDLLVDADGVGIEQPGDRGFGAPEVCNCFCTEFVAKAAERHAVEGVHTIEQLEDLLAERVVEELNLGKERLQPVKQLVEFHHTKEYADR